MARDRGVAARRARAIETQTWVVAAAQTGRHNEKRESYGHSMVVSPWGDVVLDVDPAFVGVSICDIDLGSAARVRERMPCKEHRDRGRAAIRNWPGCEGLGPRGA